MTSPPRVHVGAGIVSLGILLGVAAAADYAVAATLYPAFLGAVVLLGAVQAARSWAFSHSRVAALAALVFLVALGLLRFAALSPRKPFVAFYLQLQAGMSEEAAIESLRSTFPLGGRYARPVVNRASDDLLWFQLDPGGLWGGAYNSEFIRAEFERGRLVRAAYLWD